MDSTHDIDRNGDRSVRRTHSTTIVLEDRDDGVWLATQGGVPIEGHGESAAEAAAEYCRKIEQNDA